MGVRRHRDGSALVAVLWVLVLVGLLAMSLTDRSQLEIELLRRQKAGAVSAALAESGVAAALFYLEGKGKPPPKAPGEKGIPFQRPGDRLEFPLTGGRARVTLSNAACKANVNLMSTDQISRTLQWLELSKPEADGLANAIADWLDADDNFRPGSAERADYALEGGLLPPNGPVAVIAGLTGTRGLTPRLLWGDDPYQADGMGVGLADLLDTEGQSTRPCIDPATADWRLLVGGLGLDPETASAFLADRESLDDTATEARKSPLDHLSERLGAQKMLEIKEKLPSGLSDELFIESVGLPGTGDDEAITTTVRVRLLNWTDPNTGEKHMDILRRERL